MYLVIIIVFLFLIFAFPTFRCIVFHPAKVVVNGVRDLYKRFKYKEYNKLSTGELVAYVGLSDKPFGNGKTLSVVHRVVSAYSKFNDKPVFDAEREKFVVQKVHIISNVRLTSIPYECFESLEQVVKRAEMQHEIDYRDDTYTVILVLGDEFSVQMNSRSFKTNIDPLFLNTLLTCRHYHISMYYTTQRFCLVDALLRQVTSSVIGCNKLWRFQRQSVYDAYEMENATTPSMIKPLARKCWFVLNSDYAAYDTYACVGNLIKSFRDGDLISEDEILKLQCSPNNPNMDVVTPSRKFMRVRKKINK